MCNVSEGILEECWKECWKEGWKEGWKRGWKRGQEIGEKRATQETLIEDTLNLMDTLKMSAEDVLTAMRVPAKSRASLLKLINERLASE